MDLKAELSMQDIKRTVTQYVEAELGGSVAQNGITLHISKGGNSPVEQDYVSATGSYKKGAKGP